MAGGVIRTSIRPMEMRTTSSGGTAGGMGAAMLRSGGSGAGSAEGARTMRSSTAADVSRDNPRLGDGGADGGVSGRRATAATSGGSGPVPDPGRGV